MFKKKYLKKIYIYLNLKKGLNKYFLMYSIYMELELIKNEFKKLETASHSFFANKFYTLTKDEIKFIYNTEYGWYSYNRYNVLSNTGKAAPLQLNQLISEKLHDYLDITFNLMSNHIRPHEQNYKTYLNIYRSAYKNVGNNKYKASIIDELKIKYEDVDIINKIDSNEKLLAFNNKVFDFNNKEFRDITQDDYIMTTTNYDLPSKDEKIINELKVIVSSIFENEEIETYFFDTLGYSLFTNKFEKLHLWSGSGGNGKGLIMELINKSFGDHFYIPDSKFLTCKFKMGAANPDLYKCKNKKLVMVSEPEGDNENDIKFNIELVKKLTGRDDITCRDLFKSNITYNPKFTLFVQCNEQPRLDKVEQALSRRFSCLNFPFQFVNNPKLSHQRKINYELKDIIKDERYYKQFMFLLIDHIKPKINKNLLIPDEIKNNTNEYINDNNVVLSFIDEFLEVTNNPKDKVKTNMLYDLYKSKTENPLSRNKFLYNMKQNGFIPKKIQGYSYFKNIKIREEQDEEEENINPLDI